MDFDIDEFKDTWDDIEPYPAPQDENLPFYVKHTRPYDAMMGVFRVVIDKKEYSKRALDLTKYIVMRNPTNITAWWYREQVLEHIGYKWEEEMDFVDDILFKAPKPYQAWNHKRWLDDRCETVPDEEKRLYRIISQDQKNFHAYNFFCWFVRRWGYQSYFLELTKNIISLYPDNNSAFNFRYFLVKFEHLSIKDELDFALNALERKPDNESATSYIRGLFDIDQSIVEEAKTRLTEFVKKNQFKQPLALLFTIARLEDNKQEMDFLCDRLINIDPMKKVYWEDIKSNTFKFA